MESILRFLLQFPPWLAMVVGSTLFIFGSCVLAVLVGMVRTSRWQTAFKCMWPPLCASLMVAYAIFAVIMANISWRNHEDAMRATYHEAYVLERIVSHLPAADSDGKALLKRYMVSVIDQEWPNMRSGESDHPDTDKALADLLIWSMSDQVPYTSAAHAKFIQDMVREASTVRERRLTLSHDSIPDVLWIAVLASAIAVLLTVAMTHAHNLHASLLMSGLYGAVMGTVLTTMILLDHPYTGSLSVTPFHIQNVLQLLQ